MVDFIPRYVRANVLRGQAALWIAAFSATTPIPMPMDTLALGGDWADVTKGNPAWKPVGATDSGVTMRFTRETTDITIEEQVNPVDVATNTLDPRIEATLSEDTLETMVTAYGGGTITAVAKTVSTPGISTLAISSELTHLTMGMEAQNNMGFWRRVLFPDVLSVAQVETSYRRAETQRLYAVSFRMVNPLSALVIKEMTAAAGP
jgi:hypothetical protein